MKKTKARKCSRLGDSLGLVPCVHAYGAGVQDRDGAVALFKKMGDAFPLLDTIYADGVMQARRSLRQSWPLS